MKRASHFFILLALSGASQAQQVYKCRTGQAVSYQSEPCAEPERIWEAPPDVIDPAIIHRNAQIALEMDRRRTREMERRMPGTARSRIATSHVPSRCETAKLQRAAAYERLGHKRTFAQSRHWDEHVFNICK